MPSEAPSEKVPEQPDQLPPGSVPVAYENLLPKLQGMLSNSMMQVASLQCAVEELQQQVAAKQQTIDALQAENRHFRVTLAQPIMDAAQSHAPRHVREPHRRRQKSAKARLIDPVCSRRRSSLSLK